MDSLQNRKQTHTIGHELWSMESRTTYCWAPRERRDIIGHNYYIIETLLPFVRNSNQNKVYFLKTEIHFVFPFIWYPTRWDGVARWWDFPGQMTCHWIRVAWNHQTVFSWNQTASARNETVLVTFFHYLTALSFRSLRCISRGKYPSIPNFSFPNTDIWTAATLIEWRTILLLRKHPGKSIFSVPRGSNLANRFDLVPGLPWSYPGLIECIPIPILDHFHRDLVVVGRNFLELDDEIALTRVCYRRLARTSAYYIREHFASLFRYRPLRSFK